MSCCLVVVSCGWMEACGQIKEVKYRWLVMGNQILVIRSCYSETGDNNVQIIPFHYIQLCLYPGKL